MRRLGETVDLERSSTRCDSRGRRAPARAGLGDSRGGRAAARAGLAGLLIAAASGGALAADQSDAIWRQTLPGESAIDVAELLAARPLPVDGADGLTAERRAATIRDLLDGVLQRNLGMRIADHDQAIAAAAVRSAEGAFDPLLRVNTSYQFTDSKSRGDLVTRLRDASPPPAANEQDVQVTTGCVIVDGEVLNPTDPQCYTPPTLSTEWEWASFPTLPHTPFDWAASIGVDKLWSWGTITGVSVGSTLRHKNSYVTGFNYTILDVNDPFAFGNRAPWTSNAQIYLSTPLPFTKGFGEAGTGQSVDLAVAEESERRAVWQQRAVRDAALRNAMTGYWSLVESYLTIQTVARHLATMEERLARAERRYASGLITNYDIAQTRAATETLRNRLEILRNTYVAASTELLTLAAREDPAVLIPTGFEDELGRPIAVRQAGAAERALENNPRIHLALADLRVRDTQLEYRENQLLPDIGLDVSFGVGQSDATFGYETWSDSIANLPDPDSHNLTVLLSYRLPLWQRAEEAAASRARLQRRQAADALALTRTQVAEEVSDAIRRMASAEALVAATRADVADAITAYEKALDMNQRELVTEFELLNRYDDVLAARLRHISALVQARVGEVRLLAAEGRIEERAVALLEGAAR